MTKMRVTTNWRSIMTQRNILCQRTLLLSLIRSNAIDTFPKAAPPGENGTVSHIM